MVKVSGVFRGSTIDHMYTNVEHLFTTPEVIHIGDSDHDAPMVRKITRIVPDKPSTIKKRIYENFSEDTLLAELLDNDVKYQVQESTLEEVDKVLCRELNYLVGETTFHHKAGGPV